MKNCYEMIQPMNNGYLLLKLNLSFTQTACKHDRWNGDSTIVYIIDRSGSNVYNGTVINRLLNCGDQNPV